MGSRRIATGYGLLAWMVVLAMAGQEARGQGQLYRFDGAQAEDSLGWSVAAAGDVDGDGYPDVIVGADQLDDFFSLYQAGYARVYSGRDGSVLHHFTGSGSDSYDFGISVAGAGDVDNDGFPDLIVGAVVDAHVIEDPGEAFVYSGRDGTLIYKKVGLTDGDDFGRSVSGAGDLNQDGFDDVIVGAPEDFSTGPLLGRAFVFSGPSGGGLYTASGASAYDFFGRSVAGVGDLSGDSIPDLLVGAPGDDNKGSGSGSVRVISGATGISLYQVNGDASGDALGVSVGWSGDINQDGRAEFVAGAPGDDDNGNNCGSVRVFSGLDGLVLRTFYGEVPTLRLGGSVSGAGDLNEDGTPDLIAGSWELTSWTWQGGARAWSGADGTELFTLYDVQYGLGFAVSDAGDINGDGIAEVLIGAPYTDFTESAAGSAYVLSGRCGTITSYGAGCPGSGGFVPVLSVSGCAVPGGTLNVGIANGLGGAPVLMFASDTQVSLPLGFGCTLLVFPLLQVYGVGLSGSGPGNGTFSQSATLPIETPLGSIMLQAAVLDAGGAKGYALTNGVKIDVE